MGECLFQIDFVLFVESTTIFDADLLEYDYVGEVDMNGNACGHGIATNEEDDLKKEGTFLNNEFHGIGN